MPYSILVAFFMQADLNEDGLIDKDEFNIYEDNYGDDYVMQYTLH